MPSFDVVSEVDAQEVRNAVDQAQREIATRFDFKNTNSSIDQKDMVITLATMSEDRLNALRTVLEEKLVKRGVSLKGVDYGDVQEATQNTVRQVVTIKVGISSDKAREINKLIKEKAEKGTSSQTQGDSIRVTAKKRDTLQGVIAMLKAEDIGIPLQFENFRELTEHAERWCLTPALHSVGWFDDRGRRGRHDRFDRGAGCRSGGIGRRLVDRAGGELSADVAPGEAIQRGGDLGSSAAGGEHT